MKQPYEKIIRHVEPRLNELGFHREEDSDLLTKFKSKNYCLEFFLEGREFNLSKSIHRLPEQANSTLDTFALMPAIDPAAYDRLIESHRRKTIQGEQEAMNIYVSFLETYADIVFSFPLPEPHRTKFIEKVNEVMSTNFGRSTNPEEFNI